MLCASGSEAETVAMVVPVATFSAKEDAANVQEAVERECGPRECPRRAAQDHGQVGVHVPREHAELQKRQHGQHERCEYDVDRAGDERAAEELAPLGR